jgi:hypothetical protein
MHGYPTARTGFRGFALLAWLGLWLAAGAASATPIDVFFRGTADASGQEFGIDAATAQALGYISPPVYDFQAQTSAGLVDVLRILSQDVDESSLILGETPSVTSNWTVANNVGQDLLGTTWLLFTTVDSFVLETSQGPLEIGYDPFNVGLRIDLEQGWSIVKTTDSELGDLYYPAITLGTLLANDERRFGVTYLSDGALQQGDPDQLALPRLRLAIAFRPIPEPGTAVLVAVGLIALALRRRVGS